MSSAAAVHRVEEVPEHPPMLVPAARPSRWDAWADGVAALVALAFVVALGIQIPAARFFTDECFHAHVARWIAAHGALPSTLPELYGGFAYAYPPLFHVIGAAVAAASGGAALPWINLALTALMLGVLAFGPPAGTPRAARRWAVLLCAGNAAVATYALRFYAEALTTGLAAAMAILLLRLRARGSWRAAFGLGLALGLALLTKTAALALLLFPLGAAGFWWMRGERRLAGQALAATLLGVALALPMWIRNHALFGSAFYPAFAPDLNADLYRLHLERFGLPAAAFYRHAWAALGPAVLAVAVGGLLLSVGLRRNGVAVALAAGALALVLVAPAFPVHDVRHVLPLVAPLALAGALLLAGALGLRGRRIVDGALVLAALVGAMQWPWLRARLDPPAPLQAAYRAVAEHVPAGGTVLSLWTYDTFYHSARPATWPVAWGQAAPPLEPFTTTDPARLLRALDRHRIDAILMPLSASGERFDGANYPRSFVTCVAALIADGRLEAVWHSRSLALVRRAPARARGRGARRRAPR